MSNQYYIDMPLGDAPKDKRMTTLARLEEEAREYARQHGMRVMRMKIDFERKGSWSLRPYLQTTGNRYRNITAAKRMITSIEAFEAEHGK